MLIINSDIVLSIVQKKINMSVSKEISALAKGSENSEGLWTARTKNTSLGGAVVFPADSQPGPEAQKELAALPPCPPSLHCKRQTVRREREESPGGAEKHDHCKLLRQGGGP